MTKSALSILAAAGLFLGSAFVAPAPVTAGEDHGAKPIAVKGEILDMACYVGHGAKGKGHAECAKQCAKSGQPIGLIADDGAVYLLYASHTAPGPFEKARARAGEKVEITGALAERNGIKGLEVQDVKPL